MCDFPECSAPPRQVAPAEPMFRSAHEALTFAYLFSSQQYPVTGMARMMRRGTIGSGRGLVGLDGAAQAGMVLSLVSQLTQDWRDVIVLRFAPPDWAECGPALVRVAHATSVACSEAPVDLRLHLAARHFGKLRAKNVELAKQFGAHQSTISRQAGKVGRFLTGIEIRAQEMLFGDMERRGLVE